MNRLERKRELASKSKEFNYIKEHSNIPEYVKNLYNEALTSNLTVKSILENTKTTRTQYKFMCDNYLSIPEYRKFNFGRSNNYIARVNDMEMIR